MVLIHFSVTHSTTDNKMTHADVQISHSDSRQPVNLTQEDSQWLVAADSYETWTFPLEWLVGNCWRHLLWVCGHYPANISQCLVLRQTTRCSCHWHQKTRTYYSESNSWEHGCASNLGSPRACLIMHCSTTLCLRKNTSWTGEVKLRFNDCVISVRKIIVIGQFVFKL